jgi:predicted transcriptional regulator
MNRLFQLLQSSPANRLGPLEEQLLQALWKRGSATVRELLNDCNPKLAYTTVMTTLDRLHKKDVLARVPEGRAYRYSPRQTAEDFHRAVAAKAIRELLNAGAATASLSHLVEAVTEHDRQLLDELLYLVERKRLDLKEAGKR